MSDHEQTLRELARWKGFTEPAQAACLAGADALVRLAALSSAPPDLENLVLTYQRLCRKRDEAHANGKPATAIDAEFELKGIHYGLLAWSPAPPVAETPTLNTLRRCGRCGTADLLFDGTAYKCVQCMALNPESARPASPVVAPAPVVETRNVPIPPPKLYWRCFHCNEVFVTEADAAEHFGPRGQTSPACVAALSPRETAPGGGR